MRTRTKWLVAGGAAACVLAPVVAVSASTSLDQSLERGGVVVDADLANRARADRLAAAARPDPTASPAPNTAKASVVKAKEPTVRPTKEPAGKKTVSAETPVSPHSATSPVSPKTPG